MARSIVLVLLTLAIVDLAASLSPNISVTHAWLHRLGNPVGNETLYPVFVEADSKSSPGDGNGILDEGPVCVLVSTVCSILTIKGLQSVNSWGSSVPLCCAGALLLAVASVLMSVLTRDHVLLDTSPATRMAHIYFAATSGFIGAVGFNLLIIVYLVFFQIDYVRVPGFSVMCIKKMKGMGEPCIKPSEEDFDFPTWFFGQCTGIDMLDIGSCIVAWAMTGWYAYLSRPVTCVMVLSCMTHLAWRTVLGLLKDRDFAMWAIAPLSLLVEICTLLLVCMSNEARQAEVEADALADAWVALHVTVPVYAFYYGMHVVNMGACSYLKLCHMALLLVTCWMIFKSLPETNSVVAPNISYAMVACAAAFGCGRNIGIWGQAEAKYFWDLEVGVPDMEAPAVDPKSTSCSSSSRFAHGTGIGAQCNTTPAYEDQACDRTPWGDHVKFDFDSLLETLGDTWGNTAVTSSSEDPSSGDDASSQGNPSSQCNPSPGGNASSGDDGSGSEFECLLGVLDDDASSDDVGSLLEVLDHLVDMGKSEGAQACPQGVAVIQSRTGTILLSDAKFQDICCTVGGGNLPEGCVQMQHIAVNIAARFQWANAANQSPQNKLPVHVDVPAECPRVSISGYAIWMQDTVLLTIEALSPIPSPEPAVGSRALVAAHADPKWHIAPRRAEAKSSLPKTCLALPGQIVKAKKHKKKRAFQARSVFSGNTNIEFKNYDPHRETERKFRSIQKGS